MVIQELEEIVTLIKQGEIEDESLRTRLSQLRTKIQNPRYRFNLTPEQQREMVKLLDASDPKVRKNLVLLLGELHSDASIDAIFKAYVREERRFVKSAYLTAMGQMDYRAYVPYFKEEEAKLQVMELTIENEKHVQDQLQLLSKLILDMEGIETHAFTGYQQESTLVLMTNPNCVEATASQITSLNPISFRTGVKVVTDKLQTLLPIRTYREILFQVKGMTKLSDNPERAGIQIAESSLLSFLEERHAGEKPFYYRIELKGSMDPSKKSAFLKKMVTYIGLRSKRNLRNSPSHYEVEIRMVERSEGGYYAFAKLYTLEDGRFAYRQATIATSIKPVDAALLVELAKPYMVENARVLDPFCGVGTMLIERQFVVKAHTSYGIDQYPEAIVNARMNTEQANQIIHYVNRDFFTFTHEYEFDEIFTNMPFAMGRTTQEEIYEIYKRFFAHIGNHLVQGGTVILYTHDIEYVKELAKLHGYQILKQIPITTKKHTDLIILR
ncbi:MAG: methyltransferase [Eubacteriales bacterium]